MTKKLKKIIDSNAISNKVKELGYMISTDYKDLNPVLIGVLNGSFIFLGDLTRNLEIIHEIDFIKISSYRNGSTDDEVKLIHDITMDISGRDIIIVDDIIDTGKSLIFLKNHFEKFGANSINTCAMVYRNFDKDAKPDIEYKGFEISEGFLIGYGMDYNGWGRNLKDIYIIEE
jgi:hypoxanthine phosphoribosyltransferase